MKRHATDLVSLIFGLIFLAAASWWFGALYLDLDLDLRLPNVGWFLAGGLILLGLIGLVASLRRDREPATPDAAAEPLTGEPVTAGTREPSADGVDVAPVEVARDE